MTATNAVTLLVAIIAAIASFAAQRATAKAAKEAKLEAARHERESTRASVEKDAYERARAFDTETIVRQNKRIAELSREVRRLNALVGALRTRLDRVDHADEAGEVELEELEEFDDFYEEPLPGDD